MAVVTVAGIVVYLAAHGGREIGAHIVDTDAPGTEAESVASETRRAADRRALPHRRPW